MKCFVSPPRTRRNSDANVAGGVHTITLSATRSDSKRVCRRIVNAGVGVSGRCKSRKQSGSGSKRRHTSDSKRRPHRSRAGDGGGGEGGGASGSQDLVAGDFLRGARCSHRRIRDVDNRQHVCRGIDGGDCCQGRNFRVCHKCLVCLDDEFACVLLEQEVPVLQV